METGYIFGPKRPLFPLFYVYFREWQSLALHQGVFGSLRLSGGAHVVVPIPADGTAHNNTGRLSPPAHTSLCPYRFSLFQLDHLILSEVEEEHHGEGGKVV